MVFPFLAVYRSAVPLKLNARDRIEQTGECVPGRQGVIFAPASCSHFVRLPIESASFEEGEQWN